MALRIFRFPTVFRSKTRLGDAESVGIMPREDLWGFSAHVQLSLTK